MPARQSGPSASIWVHEPAVPERSERVRGIVELLRAKGKTVTGPTDQLPDAMDKPRVVITVVHPKNPDSYADSTSLVEALSPWHDRLIPLTVGDVRSSEFANWSQLVLGWTPDEVVVSRIQLVSDVGGKLAADLYRLEQSAISWRNGGEQSSMLLGSGDVAAGLDILASANAAAVSTPLLHDFVTASVRRRRARMRTVVSVIAAVTVVLLVVSAVAVVQARAASDAAARFESERANAESVRLAGLAVDLLAQDPDLPWMLAADAIREAVTDQARDAALQVLRVVPRHVSVALPALPNALSADPRSNRLAVGYVDGTAEVRDGSSGEVLASLRSDTAIKNLALAPGGESLFLSDGTGDRVVTVPGQETVASLGGRRFWGWIDDRRVLVDDEGTMAVFDLRSIHASPIDLRVSTEPSAPRAFTVSADARSVFIVDDLGVVLIDVDSGRAVRGPEIAEAHDIDAAPDGSAALIATGDGHPLLVRRSERGLSAVSVAGNGHRVIALGTGWALVSEAGNLMVVDPRQNATADDLRASRGPTMGLGRLAENRVATVGGDGYLRLWTIPVASYPASATDDLRQFESQASHRRESGRQMLAADPATGTLTYTLQFPSVVGTVRQGDLTTVHAGFYLGDITALTRPTARNRVAYFHTYGESAVVDVTNGATVWTRNIGPMDISALLTAASPDGQRLATADTARLRSWGPTGDVEEVAFPREETPVAVLLDRASAASVVTASGTWYRVSGAPTTLPHTDPIRAAVLGPDGALYYVEGANRLMRFDADGPHSVGTFPDDMDALALRTSDDGGLIAVIGAARTVVLDSTSCRLVADLTATGSTSSAVRDVVIAHGVAYTIRADTAITQTPILNEDEVGAALEAAAPRAWTDEERTSIVEATAATATS